jgi:hypothetical protein
MFSCKNIFLIYLVSFLSILISPVKASDFISPISSKPISLDYLIYKINSPLIEF